MPYLQTDLYSEVLNRYVCTDIALPAGTQGRIPALFLPHGLLEDESYRRYRGMFARYADETGIAVVMPDTGANRCCNFLSDENYSRYVSEELVCAARRLLPALSGLREDTFVGGLSESACAAVECLLNHTDTFSAAICLPDLFKRVSEHPVSVSDNLKRIETCEPDSAVLQKFEALFSKADPREIRVYVACGSENALLKLCRRMDERYKRGLTCRVIPGAPGQQLCDHRELLYGMRWLREGRK